MTTKDDYKSSTSTRVKDEVPPPRWGKVPPSEYRKTYGVLKSVTEETFFNDMFANGASTHATPLITRASVTLLPGVYSFDKPVLMFQRALVEKLNSEFPVDTDKDGFTASGIYTNFDRLKCPAGYLMNPMSYVSVDNESYRKDELGLTLDMNQRERAITSELLHLVFSRVVPHAVNVPKISTSGMRRFTHDVQWKLAFAEYVMDEGNFDRMLNAIETNDYVTLANDFETVYAFYLQKRGQVDTPGKERRVFDLEYARSGGEKGREFAADKSVVINGEKFEDFSAIRARVVQAGPWVINCFLQVMSTSTLYALFDDYPKVFHVNTPEQIEEVIHGKAIFCSDVKEYDRSMHIDDIRLFHDVMKEYWDERLVNASYRLFTAPYYSRPLELGGRKGVWVGDPRDPSFELHGGNRSGHAFTSLVAKVLKVADSLIVLDKQFPVLGRCKEILDGKGPIGFVNNGDDEIIWSVDPRTLAVFKKNRENRANGRYVVDPEVGQGFSGQLLTRQNEQDLYYKPIAKIHTTFEKMWVPERSIGGIHRKFWTIGFIDRVTNIMKTDVGRKAWDIHMSVYRETMSHLYGDLTAIVMREHAKIKFDLNGLNYKDREVLEDPSKLHHKYLDDEINSRVIEEVTSNIPVSVVEKFIKRYYKA